MYPTLFHLGGLTVHSYGLLVALGLAIGIAIIARYASKYEGLAPELIIDLALYCVIAAFIGARLLYVLGEWQYFLANPLEIIMVQHGGLVFFGGFLLGLAALILLAGRKRLPLLKIMDAAAPGLSLGYAIGRLGCFLNGCCFGLPTTLPWGVVFPAGSLAAQYCPGEKLHPTQLYSSFLMTLVFLFIAWLYRRKKFDGEIAGWWFILYALYRFIVEFFRYSPFHWFGLTPMQWLVVPLFACGAWGLVYYRKRAA